MRVVAAELRLSPSDLSGFLSCRHRTGLDLAVAVGQLAKPAWTDPTVQTLRDRGAEHERAYVENLRDEGLSVVAIEPERDVGARVQQTVEAMRQGREVIVQGALANATWLGYADVLRRVDSASALGDWSYEPYDTKLARETRGGTILQLAVYADLLAHLQQTLPRFVWVVTPGTDGARFTATPYRYDAYAAYVRLVRSLLGDTLALGHEVIRANHYPEPVEHCDVCRWAERCARQRRADDHLCFIAGIGRIHREELVERGVPTLAAAAAMPLPIEFKPARGSRKTYARIREQARLQHEHRTSGRPVYELLPVADGHGLSRLPLPSPGDLFLDLEGARFAREGGREYLFGVWGRSEDQPATTSGYECHWAASDAEERVAFEGTMDRIGRAVAGDPGAHVYHFGHYEPSALKRLMGRYATRADQLDGLLRAERFVDLHTIVRQTLRAGVESYSIKQLEQFYGYERSLSLRHAGAHLQAIELALESNAPSAIPSEWRAAVQTYNQDDCRSAAALRDWLERLRVEIEAHGTSLARPVPQPAEPNDAVREIEARQEAARARLLEGVVPEAATDSSHPQHPHWLLAHILDWHRREDKAQYWERYRLAEMSDAELLEESQAIAGLEWLKRIEHLHYKNGKTRSVVDRYRYPLQEVELGDSGELRAAGNLVVGSIAAHDRLGRTIDIRKPRSTQDVHPSAVFQAIVYSTDVQQEALLRLSEQPDCVSCGNDLLFRRPPRLASGPFRQPTDTEDLVGFAVGVARSLDRTTLGVQGPPGSGKTYIGAQMIRALVRSGKRIGVTAVSHKVIRNLLEAVAEQESEEYATRNSSRGAALRIGHKCEPGEHEDGTLPIEEFGDNVTALAALAAGGIHILGGTPFLWSREDARATVDVLVIDEAGQMSLANALAVSSAASSLVLLGDPQQLEQPQKGSHPDGVGVSALEHVLGGAETMPPERGLFLPTTWRLHQEICSFTSQVFYEGKLRSRDGLERQRLVGASPFDGAGLWWVQVEHHGNQNSSMEEVAAVECLVELLLRPGAAWHDAEGKIRPLRPNDLRIVAPYNAQVNRLAERLAARGVPAGTVDKFQGQEAAVVIYSMASSRPEDAPRGMEFLYSHNRLNVATSRARCAAIVVASPQLLKPWCRTPRQMALANALCRFRELARQPVI